MSESSVDILKTTLSINDGNMHISTVLVPREASHSQIQSVTSSFTVYFVIVLTVFQLFLSYLAFIFALELRHESQKFFKKLKEDSYGRWQGA